MDIDNIYGTLDLQKKILLLLKEFHALCSEYNIIYSLGYGSLLGAVRHKGFIPWDDDADIIMKRKDFERLKESIRLSEILDFEYQTEKSMWIGRIRFKHNTGKDKYLPTIDVFVIDNVPNNYCIAKIKLFLIYMIQGMVKYKLVLEKGSIIMRICAFVTWLMGKPFSQKKKWEWYESISKIGNNDKTNFIESYNTIFEYIHISFNKNILDKVNLVPFEDTVMFIMDGYDEFLKKHYGNYMKLPKVKLGHHIHPEVSRTCKMD